MSDSPLRFVGTRLGGSAVDLEITAHHSVALLGDALSGIDQLAGLALALDQPPPDVRAWVFGKEIGRMPRRQALAFRRRVGYVPAGDGLLQNLTLEENVALPLRFGSGLSTGEIAGRLRLVLAVVRLGDAAGLRPADADVEPRRRAAVARALVFDPALVVLERPFDGLSGRTAAELLETVRGGETPDGGRRTVLLTGRDLPERLRPRLERVCRATARGLTWD